MDLQHILYNTVGTDFEKFLEPKELLTMSKVSKTAREGELSSKFLHLLEVTKKEYDIMRENNTSVISMDEFLLNVPLGVIYRNARLEEGTDFNWLLDYFKCRKDTRMAVFIEIAPISMFMKYIDELEPWNMDHYEMTNEYYEFVHQASIRGREDIVEYLFNDKRVNYQLQDTESYDYYPMSKKLRDLFVKHEHGWIDVLTEDNALTSPNAFGLLYEPLWEALLLTLYYATCFQEQDKFTEYYLEYHDKIPDGLKLTLNNKMLKYNMYKHDKRLLRPIEYYAGNFRAEDRYLERYGRYYGIE